MLGFFIFSNVFATSGSPPIHLQNNTIKSKGKKINMKILFNTLHIPIIK